MPQKRKSESQLVFLLPEEVEFHFDRVRPLIDEAITSITAKGRIVKYNSDYIKDAAIDRDLLIAYIENASEISMVATLEIKNYLNYRALYIRLISGSYLDDAHEEWFDLIRDFAEFIGADSIEAGCVPALARVLKSKFGFASECEMVRLDIRNTKH